LERVVQAHQYMGSEIIVEVTGDCPLLDPEIIDLGIQTFLANRGEVVSNTWQLTYPMGVDVQVFRRAALEEVAATVTDPAVREHVSLYFYEHPEKYRLIHLVAPRRWQAPEWRFQLDYPEDLAFIREVYRALEPAHGDAFGLPEIFQLLRERPELLEINRGCREKAVR
jgi:spore coat polysaccharide biosynthesis protein SpsF